MFQQAKKIQQAKEQVCERDSVTTGHPGSQSAAAFLQRFSIAAFSESAVSSSWRMGCQETTKTTTKEENMFKFS